MADNDEALELRRRARRRLIGALALVLALVIVPPWVMDLEPKPVATNLAVEIPKQDAGGLKPPPALPPAAASAKAAAGAAPPAEAKGGAIPRPPDVNPDTGKTGERPKQEAAKPPPPKPEAVARAASQDPARKEPEAKRAEGILSAETAYLVPLGAFANKENVKALEAKLAKAGVTYYTETVTTPAGEQTRVRAGPFPSREAAEKGRERLKTLGLSPGAVIARQ